MPRGGARKGAGRKKGSLTAKTRAIAEQAVQTGITPLEYMLKILADENANQARRDDMAKAAAPYCHPRLASVEHSGEMKIENRVSSDPIGESEWETKHAESGNPSH